MNRRKKTCGLQVIWSGAGSGGDPNHSTGKEDKKKRVQLVGLSMEIRLVETQ